MKADTTKGHRARLRARFLRDNGAAMADYELLELVLYAALPRVDTKPIAKALLERFDTLGAVLAAPPDMLRQVQGVGETVIVILKASRELGLRVTRETVEGRPILSAWDTVLEYCRIRLAHEQTERFHVLFLDSKNALIADEEQQRGTVNHTPVYPREVVKRALELGATALIMVHNHPSGNPTPSSDDVSITRDVVKATAPVGITVHDHIVIGRHGHASLRGLGLM